MGRRATPRTRRSGGQRPVRSARSPATPTSRRPSRVGGRTFERSALHWTLLGLVALKVSAIVLLFDADALQAFDLAKALYSRATEWLLVAAIGLAFVLYGFAIVPRTKLHAFVGLFLLANFASAAFAADRYVAVFGESFRYLGLTFLVDMAILYLAVAIAVRSDRDRLILGGTIAAGAVIALGYGALQFAGADPFHWSRDDQGRPFAMTGNPDIFGHYVSVIFALGVGAAAFATGRWQDARRAFGVALALAALVVTGFVATRASVLGVGVTIVAFPMAQLRAFGRRGMLRSLAIVAALVATLAIALIAPTPLGARARATLQGVQIEDRLVIYRSAIAAFEARPLLGFGVDNFGVAFPQVRVPETASVLGPDHWDSSAHDWVLQAAATTGIMGLGSLLALIGATAWSLWRSLRRSPHIVGPAILAFTAYWAQGLLTVGSISVDWFPWLVAGVAAGLDGQAAPAPARRRLPAIAIAVVAAVALVGASTGLSASRANDLGKIAYVSKDGAPSAQAAIRLDGARAIYWRLDAVALETAQRWREAGDAHAAAAARAPHMVAYWIGLAHDRAMQLRTGDTSGGGKDAVIAAGDRALASDPREPFAWVSIGDTMYDLGEYDRALDAAISAIRLYQNDADYDTLAASAAGRIADPASARRRLEPVLLVKDSAIIRVAVAKLALAGGDRAAALLNAQRALQLDPASEAAQALLRALASQQ